MRFIERFLKPAILEKKEDTWNENFLNSNENRPHNSKYAHREIRDTLNAMSFHKCFYCERKLKDVPQEVDHFIEVSERKDLAFDWHNLYLACDNCNNKINNKTIPVDQALDPCKDTDDVIREHLTFDREIIRAKNNSEKGLKTIQKYKLDSDHLDHVRATQLLYFREVLDQIRINMIREKRQTMSIQEKEVLSRFKQADYSFSLMFKILLEKLNLS